jgi:hypothetical protein
MLKTTADSPARFGTLSKALITYAVLAEYVHAPLRFLAATALTLPRFRKSIPNDIPREFVDLFAFPAWIYLRLKNRLGQEQALALARAFILPLGMAAYGAEFGLVEAPRTWDNFMKYLDRSLKQGAIRWSEVEVQECSQTVRRYRCTSCMIHRFLSAMGIPELTEPFCSLDNALYNAYLPNAMTFDRGGPGNTIASGNPFCQFNHELRGG